MKIKEIFTKDINRNIRGVIKIGQETDAIKKQELEITFLFLSTIFKFTMLTHHNIQGTKTTASCEMIG